MDVRREQKKNRRKRNQRQAKDKCAKESEEDGERVCSRIQMNRFSSFDPKIPPTNSEKEENSRKSRNERKVCAPGERMFER